MAERKSGSWSIINILQVIAASLIYGSVLILFCRTRIFISKLFLFEQDFKPCCWKQFRVVEKNPVWEEKSCMTGIFLSHRIEAGIRKSVKNPSPWSVSDSCPQAGAGTPKPSHSGVNARSGVQARSKPNGIDIA